MHLWPCTRSSNQDPGGGYLLCRQVLKVLFDLIRNRNEHTAFSSAWCAETECREIPSGYFRPTYWKDSCFIDTKNSLLEISQAFSFTQAI
jgi:hypothetical protein